jgi:uncharacterized protein
MRFRSLLISLMLLALTLPCCAQSRAQTTRHRVLLDVNTVLYDGWAQAIVDAQNLLATFGPAQVEIEVVVRGPGLAMLMKSDTEFADKLAALDRQGVRFSVCGQTLAASHSTARELLPFVTVIDSGVGELVRRQESGWSYINGGLRITCNLRRPLCSARREYGKICCTRLDQDSCRLLRPRLFIICVCVRFLRSPSACVWR